MTENKLRVVDIFPNDTLDISPSKADVLDAAICASDHSNPDPIDEAIFLAGQKIRDSRVTEFEGFDPTFHRYTKAYIEDPNLCRKSFVIKGPLLEVLNMCSQNLEFENLKAKSLEYASWGFRSICIASSDCRDGFVMPIGIIAFEDPVRSNVRETISIIQNMDVQTLMLTGDSLAVAQFVCRRAGLSSNNRFFSGESHLLQECMDDDFLGYSGFASLFPQDKVSIVEIYHSFGFIVGMYYFRIE